MRLSDIFRLRLRSLFSRPKVDRELDEELRYHLERQIEEAVAGGMSREEARRAALRSFANFEQRKEECRDTRGLNLMDNMAQDVRFGLRQLGRNRAFTATAIGVLALGIAASTAIFSFVDAALIRPLPYRDPSRLAGVFERIAMFPTYATLSWADYVDWKRMNHVFQSLDVWTSSGFILTTRSGAELADAARVSAGFFRTLGVHPALGRDFYTGEDRAGAPRTIILSDGEWHKRYGGDPRIIGRTLTLDGEPWTVIGVLPATFHFAPLGTAEYWAPEDPNRQCEQRRSCHNLFGVGRLKDGVSFPAARAEMVLIAQQLEKQYPDSNRGQGANVVPLTEALLHEIRPILLALLGGAGLLLLIAAVNVASLLLVRAESRRREIAVRSALGASRVRLMRLFVTEAVLLVICGAGIGLTAGAGAMRVLVLLIPSDVQPSMPWFAGVGLNLRVGAFAFAIALAAAILFALAAGLHLSRMEVRDGLTEGSRGSAGNAWRRLGSRLVVVELATAMMLLAGAALLGQSFYRLLHVELGFLPAHLATLRMDAPNNRYGKEAQEVALGREIVSRLSNVPGVESVALATRQLPVSYNGNTDWIRFVGRPYHGEHNEINERDVSAGYFKTIGAKLLRGRPFTDAEDGSTPHVAIINQALARKYYPGEDPIGKQIGDDGLSPHSIREIVGIVEDMREGPLDSEIEPAEYLPINQAPDTDMALIVHTSQDPDAALPELVKAIRQVDPGIVTLDERSMEGRIAGSASAWLHRSCAWVVSGFAAVALLLSVIGLYGVIAYSVSLRTREIGVRIALGAERGAVYRLILKEGGWLTVFGIAGGALGSLASSTLIGKLLFGIRAWDLPTLAGVSAMLAVAALAASYIPARRAASVDPMEALRAE